MKIMFFIFFFSLLGDTNQTEDICSSVYASGLLDQAAIPILIIPNPLIGRKRPGEHYGEPVRDLRHHVHGAVPVGAVQRGGGRVQHVSCHKNIWKPILNLGTVS